MYARDTFDPPVTCVQSITTTTTTSTAVWQRRRGERTFSPGSFDRVRTYVFQLHRHSFFPSPFPRYNLARRWTWVYSIQAWIVAHQVVPFYFSRYDRRYDRDAGDRTIEMDPRRKKTELGTETNRTVRVPWQGNNVWWITDGGKLWSVSEKIRRRILRDDDASPIVFFFFGV